MKLSLYQKIVGIVVASIVISTAVIGTTSLLMSKKMADTLSTHVLKKKLAGDIHSAQDAMSSSFGQVHMVDDQLVDVENNKIAGTFEFVDTLSRKLGIVATIFARENDDFKRITTNIKKEDGRRAVGTFLGKASAAYQPIMAGELYLGNANILGKPYLTAYDPIVDDQGKPIGILFIGIASSDIAAMIADDQVEFRYWLGGITLVVVIGGILLAFIFAKGLAGAVSFITSYMVRFADGDIQVDESDISKFQKLSDRHDEVGSAARAFNNLTSYMRDKVVAAQEIANGDFAVDIQLASEQDAFGQAFKLMTEKLNATLTQVRDSANQVNSMSMQISDASTSLSQGATESAASIEEISASMTEVGSQTNLNSENASAANELAVNAQASAEKGNDQMVAMMQAMEEINDSSSSIAKIIKTIDEIAFQTNLLALNAAVEAARAGQHGKGFAVVAEEVRNLAARSAKAAKETEDLIATSVERVKNGSNIATETASALAEIVDGVTKAANLVSEIAVASKEQAAGISQVTYGMQQIDAVTQQNTANAEETAAASNELSGQAEQLNALLAGFTLRQSQVSTGLEHAAPVMPHNSWASHAHEATRQELIG